MTRQRALFIAQELLVSCERIPALVFTQNVCHQRWKTWQDSTVRLQMWKGIYLCTVLSYPALYKFYGGQRARQQLGRTRNISPRIDNVHLGNIYFLIAPRCAVALLCWPFSKCVSFLLLLIMLNMQDRTWCHNWHGRSKRLTYISRCKDWLFLVVVSVMDSAQTIVIRNALSVTQIASISALTTDYWYLDKMHQWRSFRTLNGWMNVKKT